MDDSHDGSMPASHGSVGIGLQMAIYATIVTSVVVHCYYVYRGFLKSGIYALVLRQSLYSESLMILLVTEKAEKHISGISAFANICLSMFVMIATHYRLSRLHRNLLVGSKTSYTIRFTSVHLSLVPILGVVTFAYSGFLKPLLRGIHMTFVFTFIFSGVVLLIIGVYLDSRRKYFESGKKHPIPSTSPGNAKSASIKPLDGSKVLE